jgi:hypothetical protein
MALAQQGEILAHVAMPIAGMLSDLPAVELARQFRELRDLSSRVADAPYPQHRARAPPDCVSRGSSWWRWRRAARPSLQADLPAVELARQFRELRDLSSRVADWEPPYRVFKAIEGTPSRRRRR